jgi:hypothetical protein
MSIDSLLNTLSSARPFGLLVVSKLGCASSCCGIGGTIPDEPVDSNVATVNSECVVRELPRSPIVLTTSEGKAFLGNSTAVLE